MQALARLWNQIRDIFGFRKNSKYVSNHLNEANIRTSIYMCAVIFIIEVWMIIRSTNKYVIPAIANNTNWFDALFSNTSLFWLFAIASIAMMTFGIYFLRPSQSKKSHIVPFVLGGLLVTYALFIIKEAQSFKKWDVIYYRISNEGVIAVYLFAFLLGIFIVLHTLFKMRKGKNSYALSIVVTIMFALMCLVFGVKVGYTDFFSRFTQGTGLPKANADGEFEIKSMLCFLTMVIYVGCLLIWKPYISIGMLTGIFMAFYVLLDADSANRIFADGEKVNYITFLISLSIIAVTIYQQRVREASKGEELEYAAIHDELTGIRNLYYLETEAKALFLNEAVEISEYIFLFINIENFKTFNDQKGFQSGNSFLKTFASEMEMVFKGDIVTRQADDHFAILAKNERLDEKLGLLNRFLHSGMYDVYLELKVGGYIPTRREEDARRAIDKARYASGLIRHKYGVYYCEYNEEIHKKYHKRQYIVNHIDQAVEEGWVRPYYQPVVWSDTKELCGCEALARWIDPKYGFLSPGDFIRILEEHRLIHKLDKAIFEMVCRDLRDELDQNKNVVPVSINFSRLDFELMDAVKELNDLVEKYNIPREYIHVEVTESALTDNMNLLKDAMDKFHNLGFAIWLDDFGSGYSSLNVLKDYKFDVLKIDMKFLSAFEINPKSKDIIQCVIDLANKIGMKTLTEGVETKDQAEFLNMVGCGRLQGYLFGKPIPQDELDSQIKNGKYIVSKTIL